MIGVLVQQKIAFQLSWTKVKDGLRFYTFYVKINAFFLVESLTSSLVVLLNAVRFQGLWSHSFTHELIIGKFVSPVGNVDATYMGTKGRFYYIESEALAAKVVRIPYAGQKFAMFVVLPNRKKGLQQLTNDLDTINFNRALWNMDATEVNLLLPKFKIDFSINLNEAIKGVGITKIFSKEASLSAFAVPGDATFEEGAPVSNIFHSASITVDEKSAGVNAQQLPVIAHNSTTEANFQACWPFLFFIQDETTGAVMFAGTVNSPQL
jgi:serine protease inhibitor